MSTDSATPTTGPGLFGELPQVAPALPADERALLDRLPRYGGERRVEEIAQDDEAACRRLERRGLVKVHRWKNDPIAHRPALHAGRLS